MLGEVKKIREENSCLIWPGARLSTTVFRLSVMGALKKRRRSASAFLLGLFLSLQAMAVLPALHALIHSDASDPDHECAVTMLTHGQVSTSAVVPPVFQAPEQVRFTLAEPKTIFASVDIQLLPCRGPPASPALA